MNEQRPPTAHTALPDGGSVDTDYESSLDIENRTDYEPTARSPRGEIAIIDDSVRLSQDQRRVAHELSRLYQSLSGNQPGQYWPQALLDSAGKFNRPAFPRRGRR